MPMHVRPPNFEFQLESRVLNVEFGPASSGREIYVASQEALEELSSTLTADDRYPVLPVSWHEARGSS